MFLRRASKFFIISLFFVTVQFGPILAAENGKTIIEGWIASASGLDLVTVSHGGIALEEGANNVTISNLLVTIKFSAKFFSFANKKIDPNDPGSVTYSIGAPKTMIAGLSLSDGRYVIKAFDAPVASVNAVIDIGGQKVKSLSTYENWAFKNASFAIFPALKDDPQQPASRFYPIIRAIAEASFSESSVGKMTTTQTDEKLKTTTTFGYGAMIAVNSVRGNIERFSISGSSISMVTHGAKSNSGNTATGGFGFESKTGAITIDQYNAGTLIRNFAPGMIGTDDSGYKTVMGELKIDGIHGTFAGGSFSVAGVQISDWAVRPTKISLLGALDKLILLVNDKEKSEPTPQMIVDLVSSTYGAMRLGKNIISGVQFKVDGEGSGGLGKFVISNFSSIGIDDFHISGLHYDFEQGKMKGKIGYYGFKNIRFPHLSAILGFKEAQKKKDIVTMLEAIPTLDEISVKDVAITIPQKGENLWESAFLKMTDHIGPIPTKIKLALNGFKMPVNMLEGKAKKVYTQMGYKTFELSYNIDLAWDKATKVLGLRTHMDLKDGATISATAKLGNLPRLAFENPFALAGLALAMNFNGADALFIDNSIVDRAIKVVAAQQKIQPEAMRQQIIGMVPFVLAELKNPAFTKSVTDAVRALLEGKKTITVKVNPKKPVPIIGLLGPAQSNPGSLIDILGVQVQAQ